MIISSTISSSVVSSSYGCSESGAQSASRATRAVTFLRVFGVSFFTLGVSPTFLSRLDSTMFESVAVIFAGKVHWGRRGVTLV